MTASTTNPTVADRYRTSTRQLLAGLIVSVLFLFAAVAGFGSGDTIARSPISQTLVQQHENQALARIRSDIPGQQVEQGSKVLTANDTTNRFLKGRNSARVIETQSVTMKIQTAEVIAQETSKSALAETLELIARNGRRSSRSYCFGAASERTIQQLLPFAEVMAKEGSLTADQISFRITREIPPDEVWLEIRAHTSEPLDDVRDHIP